MCIPLKYRTLFAVRDGKNNNAMPSTAVTFVREGRTIAQLVKNSVGKLQKLN